MGTYNSAVITNAGQAMIAQSFAGSDLRFTTVKTSAYVYPAGTNFSELVTINSIKQSKGITGAAVYNSRVIKVSAMVDNAGITTAYDINTIGVYASVGTDAEQLFAVITAIDADTMPAFNNRPYSYIYELNLTVGSTENLTVTVNNAGFVNVNDLNVAVEGKLSTDGNASQVTVDFTSGDLADSDVTKDTGYTPVAKVDSGETATSLLTKISNVIKNVRWIYKLLGTSDISSVGNGTVTNAVATLKSNVGSLNDAIANLTTSVLQLRTIKSCTVNLANSNVITYTAGQAFCYYINNNAVVVFMTLAFKTTSQRDAGSSVFYLTIDGRDIAVGEPYNIPCIMSKDNAMRFCGYNPDDRKYFTVPSVWTANTEARYSGMFFGNLS